MDQMSLYFQATNTRVWARRGQTPAVWVSTQRDYVHFYGAVDVFSGQESALTLPKQSVYPDGHCSSYAIAPNGTKALW